MTAYASWMRKFAPAALFLAAACVPFASGDARHGGQSFGPRTIAYLESGWALREDLRTVGVGDSAEMNRNSRVRVRRIRCKSREIMGVTCSYDASRCLDGELDPDGDGWCQRTRMFVRASGSSDPLISAHGWTIAMPGR